MAITGHFGVSSMMCFLGCSMHGFSPVGAGFKTAPTTGNAVQLAEMRRNCLMDEAA
jgi:hypothetical protein